MVILQIRKLKKLDEWVPHELTKNQKNHCFEVSSVITYNSKTFLDWIVMYNKSGFYRTTSDDQLSVLTEKKLQSPFQSQTCMRKRSWSLFGGLVPVWSTVAFWIPAKPLHLRSMLSISEMHWKLQNLQLALVNRKGQILHNKAWLHIAQPELQKLKEWATIFCLFCHIHLTTCQVITTCSSISTTFWRENGSTTSRTQKMSSKSSSSPEAHILML